MAKCWYILGAGAIGSLFAASLHRSGLSTIVLRRSAEGQTCRTDISIKRKNATENISLPVSDNDEPEPIAHLLITTKAYDVRAAFAAVAHRLNRNSHIVLLVNGMGFMADLRSDYPDFRFTSATTTEGAYRLHTDTKNLFCHAGHGITRVGRAGLTEPPPWFKDWAGIDLPCIWEANMEECLWQKLAVNCAINPLTAIHRCKNGELSAQAELAARVKQLCDEIAAVSLAAGFNNTAAKIHALVHAVIAGTGQNQSSMLQDVMARRRTENDYISGYFLNQARRLRVETPRNEAVYKGVLALDQKNA